jgi:hypothetical protein
MSRPDASSEAARLHRRRSQKPANAVTTAASKTVPSTLRNHGSTAFGLVGCGFDCDPDPEEHDPGDRAHSRPTPGDWFEQTPPKRGAENWARRPVARSRGRHLRVRHATVLKRHDVVVVQFPLAPEQLVQTFFGRGHGCYLLGAAHDVRVASR